MATVVPRRHPIAIIIPTDLLLNDLKNMLICVFFPKYDSILMAFPYKGHVPRRPCFQHPMVMTSHSVVTTDLTVRLGQTQKEVLKRINLSIHRGSLHMLLGPNGCGKSTLLRVLGGLIAGYSGEICIDSPSGFVFQNPDHQVVMPTVAADVAFGLGR
jgi:ABC-type multidrug transport system fused ATPase/permease subunit